MVAIQHDDFDGKYVGRLPESFGRIAKFSQEADMWWVNVEPGDYMAFSEPWDSGEYDA